MMKDHIVITESDYTRLCNLVNNEKSARSTELKHLEALGAEIKRAKRIDPHKIKPEFVTMNSRIEVADTDTNRVMTLQLVYPREADVKQGKISVLSPLGSALLGYKAGSIVSFDAPGGRKQVKILTVVYQPEANGEYLI
ncbi:MAG: nucleoside diphosphate kinase regulator [Mangrovibacterium sp.]